jgi:hypothetical protein
LSFSLFHSFTTAAAAVVMARELMLLSLVANSLGIVLVLCPALLPSMYRTSVSTPSHYDNDDITL